MDAWNEQRVTITFCFKAGLSATGTLVLAQKAYGNEAMNHSNDFRCYSRFRDGRELIEDDERGGHPKSTRTEVNIAPVADLVKNDRRIASRMIAESSTIPTTVVLRILEEDLGKRKLCARFVPHSLTPEQREDRVTSWPSRWPMQTKNLWTALCMLTVRPSIPLHSLTFFRVHRSWSIHVRCGLLQGLRQK